MSLLSSRRRLVCGGAALLASPWPVRAAEDLPIGQNITLQDGRNAHGVAVLAGVTLLVDAVNRDGGVGGRRLALRTLDDQNSADTAEANARRLVREGAFVLFGSVEGGPSGAVRRPPSTPARPSSARWRVRRRCAGRTSRWSSRCGPSTATSSGR